MSEESSEEIIERILSKGDIGGLPIAERNLFLVALAKHYGLDPAGRPFDIIKTKDGRMIPYANKNAAEQLRKIHCISLEVLDRGLLKLGEAINPDIYVVTARASMTSNGEKRINDAIGAVSLKGQMGDDLANKLMTADTKAQRRATYAICGLGMLDETEVATLPQAQPIPMTIDEGPKRVLPGPSPFTYSIEPPISLAAKPQAVSKPLPRATPAPTRHPPAVPPFSLKPQAKKVE